MKTLVPFFIFFTSFILNWAYSKSPNIIVILTDDEDILLNGLTPLTKTKKLIQKNGATFTNAFVTTPICCPSRSSFLTGLYMHSHGTLNNSYEGGCSSSEWQIKHEPNSFGAVLHRTGYKTFYGGKYLNKYGFKTSGGIKHVPAGWDWWIGLKGNSVYYNYTLSVNGSAEKRGCNENDYLTDVLKDYSLMFLNDRDIGEKPFLMFISPPAPHEPFTPPKRHEGKFSGVGAPRTPNFNIYVNKTKHWLLRIPPEILPSKTILEIDSIFQKRWESLLAVDDLVEAIVSKLEKLHILDNTYIIFTSDHGFHLGQFGQPWDKRQPYETDIRVPLLIRGPGIHYGQIEHPVLNIDIASTILNMAGVKTHLSMDGVSFFPLLKHLPTKTSSRNFLIEYQGEWEGKSNECCNDPNVKLCELKASCKCFDSKNNTFVCLRHLSATYDDIYCIFDDDESFRESYNIKEDPFEMFNKGRSPDTEIYELVLECCKRKIKQNKKVHKCLRNVFSS